ncbi:MAG: hypothetical protein HZY79_00635 [Rhodoblastus sp.]|nr:MAG: hypothetical protein HZY79_00635 [Rhodoblastus sp.]
MSLTVPASDIVAPSDEDLSAARRSTLFGRLPEEAFRRLFEEQKVVVAGKDMRLMTWGERADTCYIVLRGLVKLVRTTAARRPPFWRSTGRDAR